eukprot:TRINITY_DN860_c0_g1_i1.p1 TRINITY_DN860_c0_g1~~TRINITY_DN860_c0_g1_i1.p1  ORF type:complete len:352 (-),score=61.32 TRINITY_DN860_c0_g1_i1:38-1093(-)
MCRARRPSITQVILSKDPLPQDACGSPVCEPGSVKDSATFTEMVDLLHRCEQELELSAPPINHRRARRKAICVSNPEELTRIQEAAQEGACKYQSEQPNDERRHAMYITHEVDLSDLAGLAYECEKELGNCEGKRRQRHRRRAICITALDELAEIKRRTTQQTRRRASVCTAQATDLPIFVDLVSKCEKDLEFGQSPTRHRRVRRKAMCVTCPKQLATMAESLQTASTTEQCRRARRKAICHIDPLDLNGIVDLVSACDKEEEWLPQPECSRYRRPRRGAICVSDPQELSEIAKKLAERAVVSAAACGSISDLLVLVDLMEQCEKRLELTKVPQRERPRRRAIVQAYGQDG